MTPDKVEDERGNANQESKQRDKDEDPQWLIFASEELV